MIDSSSQMFSAGSRIPPQNSSSIFDILQKGVHGNSCLESLYKKPFCRIRQLEERNASEKPHPEPDGLRADPLIHLQKTPLSLYK